MRRLLNLTKHEFTNAEAALFYNAGKTNSRDHGDHPDTRFFEHKGETLRIDKIALDKSGEVVEKNSHKKIVDWFTIWGE